MADLYFWKPTSRPLVAHRLPIRMPKHASLIYTNHGIVYAYLEKHNDKIFETSHPEDSYFTYYSMAYNGKLWLGKSYGGVVTAHGIRRRAKKFYDILLPVLYDEAALPAPPPDELQLELAQTRDAANRLVDLILSWISSTFPRMGIVFSSWHDYPLVLREAMALLNRGGEKPEKECWVGGVEGSDY